MKRTEHRKIVRDRIPEIIERSGQRPICRKTGSVEAVVGLEKKLEEELAEYLQDHSLEEMADLLEVMHGILHHRGIPWEELEAVRRKKLAERGGFETGIYLEAVETDE